MSEEHENLNEMLNDEEISEGSTDIDSGMAIETAEAPVAEVATADDGQFISLYEYLNRHQDKIQNAAIANISGFSRVPETKYILFVTNEEDNADMVLFDKPNTLWMDPSIVPDTIKVESSGIVVKSSDQRYYIGKNNVTKVALNNSHVAGISTISRSKTSASVKVTDDDITVQTPDVDTIKLHVKKISPRLYNAIKDMTTKEEIKAGIEVFMTKIYDLNHLIKIERELLLACSL